MNLPLPLTDAKRSAAAISVISEISAILADADSTADLLSRVLDSLSDHFGIEHGYMLTPVEGDRLRVAAGLGAAREQIGQEIALGVGIAGVAAKRKRSVRIGNMKANRRYMRSLMTSPGAQKRTEVELPGLPDSDSQIAVPLIVGDQLAVVFVAESTQPVVFSEADSEVFELMVTQIAAAVLMSQRSEELLIAKREEARHRQEAQRALEDLKSAQDLLIQQEKLASLGQLIAGIAHEVNTPLGAILASVSNMPTELPSLIKAVGEMRDGLTEEFWGQMVDFILTSTNPYSVGSLEALDAYDELLDLLELRGVEDPDEIADLMSEVGVFANTPQLTSILDAGATDQHLRFIYRVRSLLDATQTIEVAASKASKVIKALKSFVHHNHSEELHPVALVESVEEVLTLYQNMFKHGVEVIKAYDTHPTIYGHEEQLSQIWTNLLQNAVQAMNGRGTLWLSISEEDEWVSFKVTNSGDPIDEAIHDRLFEPFFTTKKSGQGTGLGLHLCRQIMTAQGGEIMYDRDAELTTFVVKMRPYRP